jgi:hypothetical protein
MEDAVKEIRKKLWLERFQTYLFVRIIAYFFWYQLAVWALVLLEQTLSAGLGWLLGPGVAGFCIAFLTGVVVLAGVLFAYDAVKYAHRIVGPLVRLRHTIKAITEGEETDLLTFRNGDLLGELKDEFNDMLKVLEQRGAVTLRTADPARDQKQPLYV